MVIRLIFTCLLVLIVYGFLFVPWLTTVLLYPIAWIVLQDEIADNVIGVEEQLLRLLFAPLHLLGELLMRLILGNEVRTTRGV